MTMLKPLSFTKRWLRHVVFPLLTVGLVALSSERPAAQARRETEGVPRSMNNRIRPLTPKTSFVVGERLEVEITMPKARPDEPQWAQLEWTEHTGNPEQPGRNTAGAAIDVSHVLQGGAVKVRTTAPWGALGLHDLRLKHGDNLVDVLTISVGMGREPNALLLTRTTYTPGEAVELSATLPPNRFYHMDNGGPTILFWPLEIGGKRLSDTEQITAWSNCSTCAVYLESLVLEAPAGEPVPPFGVKPGRYRLGRLKAPPQPGRYELRLTDRPYLARPSGMNDLWRFYFAVSPEMIVEAPGASPTALRFVKARPMPEAAARAASVFEEVTELTHGEPFFVEATFAPVVGVAEPASRNLTLEWVDLGVRQQRVVAVTRRAAGLYRSEAIVLARPMGKPQ